ncbi:MAG: glycosyltransferase [Gemmatimonadetes bacterium]|nr:glycosyltransferase [Gemmatimonadota bacterium]
MEADTPDRTLTTPSRAPLRVAAHNGARTYGGGEKWTVLLLRGLSERGHRVHLFCNFEEIAERARAEGVDASVAVLGGHLALWQAWAFASRLRAFAPDALLVSTFKKVWLAGFAAHRAGVARVVSRIGLDSDLPGKHWTYRLAFRRWVDAALVNAEGIRREVVRTLPRYDPARVATVYDGVAAPHASLGRREARAALGLPHDVPVIGSVTRLSRQKRLDRLLGAMALLPRIHCALAGVGELEDQLRSQVRTLGLEDRVHFLGYRSDVGIVLAALDAFVLTSDREGMANAMLEAMAAGVPVVSTPVSGADEALAPDGNGQAPGVIVEGAPPALAAALRGVLDDAAARSAMSEEGRRRAREWFGYRRMVDAWEGVLGGDPPAFWDARRDASPGKER